MRRSKHARRRLAAGMLVGCYSVLLSQKNCSRRLKYRMGTTHVCCCCCVLSRTHQAGPRRAHVRTSTKEGALQKEGNLGEGWTGGKKGEGYSSSPPVPAGTAVCSAALNRAKACPLQL